MLLIKNLSVCFEEKNILKNLNLKIMPGKIHIIMGPNGSGKSTLAYTIMGHPFYTITSGDIFFENKRINQIPVEERAKMGIFLACQNNLAIDGVEVFTFLFEAYKSLFNQNISTSDFQVKIMRIFDMVGLNLKFLYRNLYDGFSGGEKKRLEIAQFLLFNPRLAILDEIDSGLDIDGIKMVALSLQYAKRINPNMSIILITHYSKIIHYFNDYSISVLKEGSIEITGSNDLIHKIENEGYDRLYL